MAFHTAEMGVLVMTIGLLLIVTKNAESEEQAFNGHFDDSLTGKLKDCRLKPLTSVNPIFILLTFDV